MNNEIIEKIAQIARDERTMDDNMFNLLISVGCFGMAAKHYKKSPKLNLFFSLNSLAKKAQYSSCNNLFIAMNDIDYAVIKGEVLSERIFSNPIARLSCDIDILVAVDSASFIKRLLKSEGFIQGRLTNGKITPLTRSELIYYNSFTHQLGPFIKQTNNPLCPFVNIDVNTNVFWGESNNKIDMNVILKKTEKITLFGTEIKRLTSIYEFISLCLHHYKDLNSLYLLWERGVVFSLFCDIYYYLLNVSPNSTTLKKSCEELGVLPYVYYCVYHTNEVFHDKRLDRYLLELDCIEGQAILFRIGLHEDEYKYLAKGISHYLFDKNFKAILADLFNSSDFKKIELNKTFI